MRVWGDGVGEAKISGEMPFLKKRAKDLRRAETPAEALVWELLRGRRFQGLKFRRQHAYDGYILDFYCHEAKLCIELDGAPHLKNEQWAKDQKRDDHLRSKGIRVLRFMNEDAIKDRPQFRARLLYACTECLSHPLL